MLEVEGIRVLRANETAGGNWRPAWCTCLITRGGTEVLHDMSLIAIIRTAVVYIVVCPGRSAG